MSIVEQPPLDEPQLHPLDSCIRSALENLEDAVREQDGTEHPAIWKLTEACKWLLAGLAALNAGTKTAANLQELKDEQAAAGSPGAHGGAK
jgi:hypothetical protein